MKIKMLPFQLVNKLIPSLNSVDVVARRYEGGLFLFDCLGQSVDLLDVGSFVDGGGHLVQLLDQGHQDGALGSAGLDKLVVLRFLAHDEV